MFDAKTETVGDSRVMKYRILRQSELITFGDFLLLLRRHSEFRQFFTNLLVSSPFSAFRWETPALNSSSEKLPFEFVLLNSPRLARAADSSAFGDRFSGSKQVNDVLSFPNLGRNAQMIVPCPTGRDECYTHLASFLRDGPPEQIDRMWQVVGSETRKVVGDKTRWLSTAGGGVAWLHVRIDTKPKYYGFTEYKTPKVGARYGKDKNGIEL
ncbi:hypothetical protein LOC67_24515 [Stieleria sp. JC731]|uniref:DUF6940 family protein n=1 Tax=Pirellulaceae TaxID=2691357 RepID=UPI001E2C94D1|nr:hypothetical protein [Stieleria sp. JC731]MCC9603726.1 hypothetical protein [Stieleria sp. JC731]